jgi:hypothetical protein
MLPERSYADCEYPVLICSRPTIPEPGLYAMLTTHRTNFLIITPSIANYVLADATIQCQSFTIKGLKKYGIAYIRL